MPPRSASTAPLGFVVAGGRLLFEGSDGDTTALVMRLQLR